jgi:hypothetical protein
MSAERLNLLNSEMRDLYAALSKANTPAEFETLSDKAYDVMAELESEYGVPAFRPEVPADTQKMFFALQELLTRSNDVDGIKFKLRRNHNAS